MRCKKHIVWVLILCGLSATIVQADVRRVWDEKPLTLILPVGQELRVSFPTGVNVQVPLGISEKLTSLAPNPKMIYWTATEEFTTARIIATAIDGKTVYVIDVAAEKNLLTVFLNVFPNSTTFFVASMLAPSEKKVIQISVSSLAFGLLC